MNVSTVYFAAIFLQPSGYLLHCCRKSAEIAMKFKKVLGAKFLHRFDHIILNSIGKYKSEY